MHAFRNSLSTLLSPRNTNVCPTSKLHTLRNLCTRPAHPRGRCRSLRRLSDDRCSARSSPHTSTVDGARTHLSKVPCDRVCVVAVAVRPHGDNGHTCAITSASAPFDSRALVPDRLIQSRYTVSGIMLLDVIYDGLFVGRAALISMLKDDVRVSVV